MDTITAQAMIRFGLGRRGTETLPDDPVAWLTQQVEAPDPATFDPRLPSTADGLTVLREQRKLKLKGEESLIRPLLEEDVAAHTDNILTTPAPFRERLVWFWFNHFTVSVRAGGVNAVIGPYLREAIRPNVTGGFAGLLLAVMRHPAMLIYLDNAGSIGPNSAAARNGNGNGRRGLNENLARECLELHTVSPGAGYTQADVTEFARILTGWSIDQQRLFPGFLFREGAHEPGEKILLGRRFGPGEAGGIAALDFLAQHPATHRHLAIKLVRHFVADDPPPDAVRTIEGVLRDTGGDLGAASTALLHLPAAWTPLVKLRSPVDFAVAALRALDLPPDKRPPLRGTLQALGQPLWNAPLPNGWPDAAAEWAAPEAVMRRIDWSQAVASRAGDQDPAAIADAALGPLLRPETLDAMRHAGSRHDALTLLLTSPEFQRR
ncbi:MAG: DUF1800 domain-containing protein [Janthinobacterium lividum]